MSAVPVLDQVCILFRHKELNGVRGNLIDRKCYASVNASQMACFSEPYASVNGDGE